MNISYSKMQQLISCRANLIQEIIFKLSDFHEIPRVLSDSIPTMNHVVGSNYTNGKYVERCYFDFELYASDWDDMDHRYHIELPVELVEEFDPYQIESWFRNHFKNENHLKELNEFRNDVYNIAHLIDKYGFQIKDFEWLLEDKIDSDDKWNEKWEIAKAFMAHDNKENDE